MYNTRKHYKTNNRKRAKKQFFVLGVYNNGHPEDIKNYAELNGYNNVTFIAPGIYVCTKVGNYLADIEVINRVYL